MHSLCHAISYVLYYYVNNITFLTMLFIENSIYILIDSLIFGLRLFMLNNIFVYLFPFIHNSLAGEENHL